MRPRLAVLGAPVSRERGFDRGLCPMSSQATGAALFRPQITSLLPSAAT